MSERTYTSSPQAGPGRRRRLERCNTLFAIGLAALLGIGPATVAVAHDLSGTWVLDEGRSDDPGDVVQKADNGGKVGRILRSTSRSVVIFGIPIPTPRPNERDKPRSHDDSSLVKSGHVLSVVDTLTIHEDARAIELLYDNLEATTYEFGVALDTGYSTVTANWSGDRLVVEHALAGGGEITETYELTRSGTELHWSVHVKNEGIRTIRVSRVYERAAAGAEAARFNLIAGN